MSELEDIFAKQLYMVGIKYEREYRFVAHHVGLGTGIRDRIAVAGMKDWRFDFAILPDIAVEVEGGTWVGGAHVRGARYKEDCWKYNIATILGWRVLRGTTSQVKDESLLGWLLDLKEAV